MRKHSLCWESKSLLVDSVDFIERYHEKILIQSSKSLPKEILLVDSLLVDSVDFIERYHEKILIQSSKSLPKEIYFCYSVRIKM